MNEPFIGLIAIFGFNFAPRGWALCNGQLLSIAQNTALFSLLGTTYGGNGQTTFALPDLRGRAAIHFGQGNGLSNIDQGEVSGSETVTLTTNNMPAHTHTGTLKANDDNGGLTATPTNNRLGGANIYTPNSDAVQNMAANIITINPAGGSQPFSIKNPYLGLNFCIALEGLFPSRN